LLEEDGNLTIDEAVLAASALAALVGRGHRGGPWKRSQPWESVRRVSLERGLFFRAGRQRCTYLMGVTAVRRHLVPSTVLAVAALVICGPSAQAGAGNAFVCTSSLSGVVIHGDVSVPAGQQCRLDFSEVTGNVRVEGTFSSTGLTLDGSLFGEKGSFAEVASGVIHGNFVSHDSLDAVADVHEHVDGNVIFVGVGGATLFLQVSVGGNAVIVNSVVANVEDVFVAGNLICTGNDTIELLGVVAGQRLGQCASS
jgi:hypothetical protein